MIKRILVILVIASLVFAATACSGADDTKEPTTAPTEDVSAAPDDNAGEVPEPEHFVIGFPFMAQTNSTMNALKANVQHVVEAAGGEVLIEIGDITPEGTISSVESLIAAGVDGLFFIPPADSILPRISQMCEEAGVYWALGFRSILDEEVRATVEQSRYYVGNCHEDEEMAGYTVMQMLADQGVENLAIISEPVGNTTTDLREIGMNRAAEEMGVNILAEVRGLSQGTDAAQAVESFIASYPELDGIFLVGTTIGDALSSTIKALEQYGKAGEIKLGVIDFSDGMVEGFENGYINAACGGHLVVDPMFTAALVTNAVLGSRLSEEPTSCTVNFMYLQNAEDAANYFNYVEGEEPVYSTEEVRDLMIKYFNPEVTEESFMALTQLYSIEDVVARKSGE